MFGSCVPSDALDEGFAADLEAENGRVNAPISVSKSGSSAFTVIRAGNGVPVSDVLRPCGKIYKWKGCKEHWLKTRQPLIHCCNRLPCPVCVDATATKLAREVSNRIRGLSRCYTKKGIEVGKLRHISFSIDPTSITLSEVLSDRGQSLHSRFYRLIRDIASCRVHWDGKRCDDPNCPRIHSEDRFWGGWCCLHLWRKKHQDGSECGRKGCLKAHQWVWGPHFHYLGYGYFEDSVDVAERTGWIYNIMKDKTSRSAFSTAFYQLTHAAVFLDAEGESLGQVGRWIGAFSNSKGGKHKVMYDGVEYELCDTCHMPYHYYPSEINDLGVALDLDMGEVIHKLVTYEYYLCSPKRPPPKQHLVEDF